MTHDETTDRLRRALAARADLVPPTPDAVDRIEQRAAAEDRTARRRWAVVASAAAAAVIAALWVVVPSDGDDADVAAGTSTSAPAVADGATTVPTTPSTPTSTPETTAVPPPAIGGPDPFEVAYPDPTGTRRFATAADAAEGFAREVLGFTELIVGEATTTTAETAMVPVQGREGGPETVVRVELAVGSWYVTGAGTEDITTDAPDPGAAVTSPVRLQGRALAFEGTVNIVIVRQDDLRAVGEGFVTGSGSPPPGPYDGTVAYEAPDRPTPGIIVYQVRSGEDGRVTHAAALRVRLT